jgi:hypothetical protein
VVGPFDIGTVVVRLAIKVNPETGEVFLDSTGSDPIPHIVKGIPVHLRDIRAYTDRPQFTFNPTNCTRTFTASTVLGSGLDFAFEADDRPFTATSPFQAADCAALPFQPKLSLKLIGGTKRSQFPKLKAFLRMRGFGEAGVARAQVTLPSSEFIANAHFNTICTRVQFKAAGGPCAHRGDCRPDGGAGSRLRSRHPRGSLRRLDYGFAAIAAPDNESEPVPMQLLAQARLAARNGVGLEAVLRRYAAGHGLLADSLLDEAAAVGAGQPS